MKNLQHIKMFESIGLPARMYHGLGKDQYMVTVDMASDTLNVWADTISEMAKIAPNCIFQEFNPVTPDYWEVTIVGPEMECTAIANYWNNLTGGNEVMVEPFRLRRTR
jgi:hypothetical protein